jgi:hypothetical protein
MDRIDNPRSGQAQLPRLDLSADRPPAAATTTVADKQDHHPEPPAAPNAVIFIGPRHDKEEVARIVRQCALLKLDFTLIETDDEGLSDSRKSQLYFDGKLGPGTQVFALFHGRLNGDTRQHEIEVGHGAGPVGTLDFMQWLRTPPAGMPEGPDRAGFHGTIHLHSCKGNLRDELKAGSALWNMGSCIAYSSRKNTLIDSGVDLVLEILGKMAQSGKDRIPLAAVDLLAHAAGTSGDTMVGLGADFSAPLVVRAPKTMAETRSAYLVEALQTDQPSTNCIIGVQQDRQALLAALRKTVTDQDAPRDRKKLENTMVTRVTREDLERVNEFLAVDPALSTISMSDGTGLHELAGMVNNERLLQTIMDHRHQSLRASFAVQALAACTANDEKSLVPILNQASRQNFVLLDEEAKKLADAAQALPAMVARLMNWACVQGQIGLVKALMARQAESARSGFAQKYLAKANGPGSRAVKTYLKSLCKSASQPAMGPGQRAAAALTASDTAGIEKLLWEFRSVRLFRDESELALLLKAVSDRPRITDAMLEWACRADEASLIDAISAASGAPYVASRAAALREIALQADSPAALDCLDRLGSARETGASG